MQTKEKMVSENTKNMKLDSALKKQSDESGFVQFVDNRQGAVSQRKVQAMATNYSSKQRAVKNKENYSGLADNLKTGMENFSSFSLDDVKVHRNSNKPIQMKMTGKVVQLSKWKWDGSNWKLIGEGDYADEPKFKGKNKDKGKVYDTKIKGWDNDDEKKKGDTVAGKYKEESLKPYLDLIPHLAGDLKGKEVKGGHLLTAMVKKWGKRFKLLNESDKSDDAPWHAKWSVDDIEKNGGSSMFPAKWLEKDLRSQLEKSNKVGSSIVLSPSEINIIKCGNTFYPLENNSNSESKT